MPFGRRSSATADEAPEPAVEQVETDSGKGRPTPKRADARKARRKPSPGNRSKESVAKQRAQAREDRVRARQALITGDERHLPARDAGPERRLARDVIDSRFTLGQIFFIAIGVAFVSSLVPSRFVTGVASFASLIVLTLIVIDSARHGRRAKEAVAERFGAASARGIASYGFLRAMFPRRLRRPPPKVERGASV